MSRSQALKGPILQAGLTILVGLVFAAAGYLTRDGAGAQIPPPQDRAPGSEFLRGTVQSVQSGSISVAGPAGVVNVKLLPATPIEVIRAGQRGAIRPGDWLNAGGVSHRQTLFVLTGLVIIPGSLLDEKR